MAQVVSVCISEIKGTKNIRSRKYRCGRITASWATRMRATGTGR